MVVRARAVSIHPNDRPCRCRSVDEVVARVRRRRRGRWYEVLPHTPFRSAFVGVSVGTAVDGEMSAKLMVLMLSVRRRNRGGGRTRWCSSLERVGFCVGVVGNVVETCLGPHDVPFVVVLENSTSASKAGEYTGIVRTRAADTRGRRRRRCRRRRAARGQGRRPAVYGVLLGAAVMRW